MRSDRGVEGAAVVARAIEFFSAESAGFIVLGATTGRRDIERAALAEGFRAGWTEQPMALTALLKPASFPATLRCGSSRTRALSWITAARCASQR